MKEAFQRMKIDLSCLLLARRSETSAKQLHLRGHRILAKLPPSRVGKCVMSSHRFNLSSADIRHSSGTV